MGKVKTIMMKDNFVLILKKGSRHILPRIFLRLFIFISPPITNCIKIYHDSLQTTNSTLKLYNVFLQTTNRVLRLYHDSLQTTDSAMELHVSSYQW